MVAMRPPRFAIRELRGSRSPDPAVHRHRTRPFGSSGAGVLPGGDFGFDPHQRILDPLAHGLAGPFRPPVGVPRPAADAQVGTEPGDEVVVLGMCTVARPRSCMVSASSASWASSASRERYSSIARSSRTGSTTGRSPIPIEVPTSSTTWTSRPGRARQPGDVGEAFAGPEAHDLPPKPSSHESPSRRNTPVGAGSSAESGWFREVSGDATAKGATALLHRQSRIRRPRCRRIPIRQPGLPACVRSARRRRQQLTPCRRCGRQPNR